MTGRSGPAAGRAMLGGVAAAAGALAVWLALHHPLSPGLALLATVAAAVVSFRWPAHWPLWLLPLLPLAGLMPWTGWLVAEDWDLLVLAVAAGAWGRLAVSGAPTLVGAPWLRLWAALLLLLPLALSTAIAMHRGALDAGGWDWTAAGGWWQGFREPLNSLRLAKPVLAALLLLPPWQAALAADPAGTARRLVAGMAGLAAVVALAVVSERLAHTGLANFSTDYRVTGPFWEMHVGGAALDVVLALALPFVLAALAGARGPRRWAVAALVLALVAYAALATFSRIVYLALPLALLLWLVLARRQRPPAQRVGGLAAALVALALYGAGAAWLFPGSGYRGLLALLGAVVLLLPLAGAVRGLGASGWTIALGGGVAATVLVAVATAWVPKGAYLAYALCWAMAAGALWHTLRARRHGEGGRIAAASAVAAWLGVAAGIVAVGGYWGEAEGLARSLPVAGALLVVGLAAARRSRGGVRAAWPAHWRWQGQVLGAMAVLSVAVGVFSGGAYMGDRLADATRDVDDRRGHWSRALALMDGPADWAFGQGLGRYWALQSLSGRAEDQTGDYRLVPTEGGGWSLVLTSGKHVLGWGQIFRVSQRVAEPAPGPATLRLALRTPQAVELHAAVCEKHLLYNGSCLIVNRGVQAADGAWQRLELPMTGGRLDAGSWLAPRWIVFAIGLGSPGARVEVDDLGVVDAAGRELLVNGGFDDGMARWFFTSDHHHMPWHLKSLAVHLLFEQGLLGLAAGMLVLGAALWRTTLGAARAHPLAPPLAAALLGLLVVGLVDSVLDMPRVAGLAWWLAAVALALPAGARNAPPAAGPGAGGRPA